MASKILTYPLVKRRSVLRWGAAVPFATSVPVMAFVNSTSKTEAVHAKDPSASLNGPYLDLETPMGNVEAIARIHGDINPAATSYSWYFGRVTGWRPGEAARDIMNIIGMGTVRILPREGGPGYLMLRKELGFFTDIETNTVLDDWTNPYNGEKVTVDHIANPAINAEIKPLVEGAGLYEEVKERAPTPFQLPWRLVGDRLITEQHAHLWVKNPLDPKIWKRESAGEMIAISDSNTFNVALSDVQNPSLTKIKSQGHWVHRRPWQPWMLMGQKPGFIEYNCVTGSASGLEDLPRQIVGLARSRFPDFLNAPTERAKPESSLARFMRTRKPAPPKKAHAGQLNEH